MNEKSNKIGMLILGISFIVSAIIIAGALKNIRATSETITVTGSARKPVMSDLIVWKMQVNVFASTLPNAYQELLSERTKVMNFLREAGIPDTSINLSHPNSWVERQYYEGRNESRVIGFRYVQNISVQSYDIDKIEKIIQSADKLILSGVSIEMQQPEYLVTKLSEYRLSLLGEATKDAQERAQKIASGIGSKIGAIRSARVGVFQVNAPNSMEISDYGVYDTSTRKKEITAVVSVSFAIQ
ncbi:MAG: SIMPL domain-containing protein [bacterium]|nr:SIMPL domain-containing protein [bacterium]